ncbi:MAG TPA: hypothetical protein PLJ27_10245 [Polyangiaceae bacterium]|nr:hypothetical protein [Polyangiaceae bacterium]HNZ23360.1 hypothetical protein [Polyangiaceae bacterium]HOD25144.1 hypothetical protein [Polyangiaceae bacterium]HOE50182.1 hypothetical protein [Polyangiaceae bacterium]HOH03321.1 hypothetical protein [Polyangiaceae bacterium]
MNAPNLLGEWLPWVWVVWFAALLALTARIWRREVLPIRPRRHAAIVLVVVSLGLLIASFLVPFRVDASGLMELFAGTEPWKGVVGKSVLELIRPLSPLDPMRIILLTRVFALGSTAVAIAVVTSIWRAHHHIEKETERIDLVLLSTVGCLLLTPSYASGLLGVFNFWFFPFVMLGMLLALVDLERRPSWLGRILFWTSLPLLAYSRPETLVATLSMTFLVILSFRKRGDRLTWVSTAVLAFAMTAIAPSVFAYLDDRVRNQPLLMGGDAAGDSSSWATGWILFRRIIQHLPINGLAVGVAMHGMGLLAMVGMVRRVRARQASVGQVAAFVFFLVEFVAIGVHREGFLRYDKYGLLVVSAIWFLALSTLPEYRASTRRVLLRIGLIGSALLFVFHVTLGMLGVGRCVLPHEPVRDAKLRDMTLLWEDTPRWVRAKCDHGTTNRVVVVMLDERGEMPEQLDKRADGAKRCEPERWPLVHQWKRAGCATDLFIPDRVESIDEILCEPSDGKHGNPLYSRRTSDHPTLGIISFHRREHVDWVREFLHRRADCGWQMEEESGAALLLRRAHGR